MDWAVQFFFCVWSTTRAHLFYMANTMIAATWLPQGAMVSLAMVFTYHQTSNISHTLVTELIIIQI